MMKYGFDLSITGEYANPHLLADLAAEAEQAGWGGVFVWDCVIDPSANDEPATDPWVALAAMALKTDRIKLGALLTPLARRRPWKVARETVALDHLSQGRLIFGAGLGYLGLDFTTFGEEVDPKIRAARLDEGLEIITGLWRGEVFSFQGSHYQMHNVTFLPRPVQSPRIPVWIGGHWPNHKPFQRAARWDGVFVGSEKADEEPLTLQDFTEVVAYIKSQRDNLEPFDIAAPGVTPPDPAKGAEIVQPYLEAGATWWIEAINQGVGPLEQMKERIRSGPPRL